MLPWHCVPQQVKSRVPAPAVSLSSTLSWAATQAAESASVAVNRGTWKLPKQMNASSLAATLKVHVTLELDFQIKIVNIK